MTTKYDALEELAKQAQAGDWPEQSDFHRDAGPGVVRDLIADVRALAEALKEVTASLAWNAHGECRAIHDGPIMPSSQAVEFARAALKRIQGEGK